MNRVIATDAHDATLAAWRGAHAKIWQFHPSLSRFLVQLYRPLQSEFLYVMGITCRYVQGPFSWTGCDVRVVEELDVPEHGPRFSVRDDTAGFLLRCQSVGLLLGNTLIGLDVEMHLDIADE